MQLIVPRPLAIFIILVFIILGLAARPHEGSSYRV